MTNDVTQLAVIGGDGLAPKSPSRHSTYWSRPSDLMLLPPTSTTLAPHIGRPRERFLTTPLWPRLPRKSPSCSTLSVLPLTRQRCRQFYLERGHFALIHKHNVLVNAGTLWRRIVDEVVQEFPSVTTDYLHVDLLARRRCHDRSGTRPPAIRRHRHRQPHR